MTPRWPEHSPKMTPRWPPDRLKAHAHAYAQAGHTAPTTRKHVCMRTRARARWYPRQNTYAEHVMNTSPFENTVKNARLRMRIRTQQLPPGRRRGSAADPAYDGRQPPVGEGVFGVFRPECVDVALFRPEVPRPPTGLRPSFDGRRSDQRTLVRRTPAQRRRACGPGIAALRRDSRRSALQPPQ